MTISRSNPTSVSTCMEGDYVVIIGSSGLSYPMNPQFTGAAAHFGNKLMGKIKIQPDGTYVEPDPRAPALVRSLGPIKLQQHVQVQRTTVTQEHEKAILALQYLHQLSDVCRDKARDANGNFDLRAMKMLLGTAITDDLKVIADELTVAGVSIVEKVTTETITHRTVILTSDPAGVSEGAIHRDALTFASEPIKHVATSVAVHDVMRTSELLTAEHPAAQVTTQGDAATAAVPGLQEPEFNLLRMLGVQGDLSAADIGVGAREDDVALVGDLPDDDDPVPLTYAHG